MSSAPDQACDLDNQPNLPHAVIFDMDGLLLDSEAVMRRCFESVCAQQNWQLSDKVFKSLIGLSHSASRKILAHHVPPAIGVDAFDKAVHDAYDAQIEIGIPLKPGALELASHLQTIGVPCAVATSTGNARARLKLDRARLLPLMCALACGDEVRNGKPEPEIFLLAAERLAVKPASCVVFEDSTMGVRAALAAGMKVVQVPDLLPAEAEFEPRGVIIARSLLEGAEQIGLWRAR